MARYELKTWPEFFAAVLAGTKPFDVRYDDRGAGYQVGDVLLLYEYDPAKGYTGRTMTKTVTYVLHGMGLERGYVCLGLAPGPEGEGE